jgi:VanZ family protein
MSISVGVSDKIEHFGAYGLLGVFLFLALKFQNQYTLFNKFPATFTVLIASIYGVIDELHQLIIPGRSAEFFDWFADFTGSVLAVIILNYIFRKFDASGERK